MDPAFDPASVVLLAEPPPTPPGGGVPDGEVVWLERSPDLQRLRVRSDREALLVVADNWYGAWEATVAGEPRPVLRAYHTLRAVPVPAGEHEVVLRYAWGGPVRAGLGLTLAAWLAIALVAGLSRLRRGRGRGAAAS
jgi:hypothetical protein